MPIGVRGRVGLSFGSSAPSTIPDLLTSIGKDSFYGIWLASANLAANSDGTGSVVSGGSVGRWAVQSQVSFNYKFIQPTSGSRPQYSAGVCSDGVDAIIGNGTSWRMYLDSTTALNQACTISISVELLNHTSYVFSANSDAWSLYNRANQWYSPEVYHGTLNTGGDADYTEVRDATTTAYQRIARIAINSPLSGTAWHNAALHILASSGGFYGTHRIRQICISPLLTVKEHARLLALMV